MIWDFDIVNGTQSTSGRLTRYAACWKHLNIILLLFYFVSSAVCLCQCQASNMQRRWAHKRQYPVHRAQTGMDFSGCCTHMEMMIDTSYYKRFMLCVCLCAKAKADIEQRTPQDIIKNMHGDRNIFGTARSGSWPFWWRNVRCTWAYEDDIDNGTFASIEFGVRHIPFHANAIASEVFVSWCVFVSCRRWSLSIVEMWWSIVGTSCFFMSLRAVHNQPNDSKNVSKHYYLPVGVFNGGTADEITMLSMIV